MSRCSWQRSVRRGAHSTGKMLLVVVVVMVAAEVMAVEVFVLVVAMEVLTMFVVVVAAENGVREAERNILDIVDRRSDR